MPAAPEVVGAYLAAAGEGYAMQTLRRRVAAIARASARRRSPARHQAPGDPRDPARDRPNSRQPRPPLGGADDYAKSESFSRACEQGLAGDRDRALLLDRFRRRAAGGPSWWRWTSSASLGPNPGVKLLLEKSKTDKDGEGAEIMISYSAATRTPVLFSGAAALAR